MDRQQKKTLFYVILTIIIIINLVLILALVAHFTDYRKSSEIGFLLYIFTTELIGCMVIGWRKVIDYDEKTTSVENAEADQPIIARAKLYEDPSHPDVMLKNDGCKFLEKAQNVSLSLLVRLAYAAQAIEIFAQIKKGSPAYDRALYNIATCYWICGKFRKAISLYLKVKKLVLASEQYTKEEKRLWEADIEMSIGNVREKQGNLQRARDKFFKAYIIDPDNYLRLLNLFDLAIKMKNLEEALRWKELLSSYPEYPSFSEMIETKLAQLQKELERTKGNK